MIAQQSRRWFIVPVAAGAVALGALAGCSEAPSAPNLPQGVPTAVPSNLPVPGLAGQNAPAPGAPGAPGAEGQGAPGAEGQGAPGDAGAAPGGGGAGGTGGAGADGSGSEGTTEGTTPGGAPSQTPKGGVETGGGATDGVEYVGLFSLGGLALAAAGTLGAVARRRREV